VRPKQLLSLWYVRRKTCTYLATRLALSPNEPKRAFTWAWSTRSSVKCVQTDFWASGTIGAKTCTYLASTLTLSPNGPKQDWHDPHHLGVQSGSSKMIFDPVERSMQTVHLSCIKISTISKRTETRFHMDDVTYRFHHMHPKWFYEPVVCLTQTVQLSCTDTNTISKQTKTRFHITHVLWYFWRKTGTYIATRLTLSPNGPKQASTWAWSTRSSIECVQNDFWAYRMFGANHATILHRY
jgi:hypothetical protein